MAGYLDALTSSTFRDAIMDQVFQSRPFFSHLMGPTRPETDAEWHERLRKDNRPNPKFDTDAARKRVKALRKWVRQGRSLAIVQDVQPDEESWEDAALYEIGQLEAGLRYGPFITPRCNTRG